MKTDEDFIRKWLKIQQGKVFVANNKGAYNDLCIQFTTGVLRTVDPDDIQVTCCEKLRVISFYIQDYARVMSVCTGCCKWYISESKLRKK